MKIAVASGKGGTGKTTVAVSLALCCNGRAAYVDCDVEEPNGHIFMNPSIIGTEKFTLPVPSIKEELCNYCGRCKEICRFNAITMFGRTIMTFTDMCHACGGCFLVCENRAIVEQYRTVGTVEWGNGDGIDFFHGRLRVGEAMSSPLIKRLKRKVPEHQYRWIVLDSPPGTSCPVIKTVRDSDFVILVTEPTPFGLHDLKLAAATVSRLGIEMGVIINKWGIGDCTVETWCRSQGLPILMTIPFSKEAATAYASGIPLVEAIPELRKDFEKVLEDLEP